MKRFYGYKGKAIFIGKVGGCGLNFLTDDVWYEVLKDGIIGKITMKSTGDEFLKLMSPQSQHKAILELFQSENVVRRGYLKSMGIK